MSKIVQISEAASIAIHAMVLIARSKEQLNANQIAEMTGASRNHLAKVLQWLGKKDWLKSNRGPKGGFTLKKPADQITLLEIYECIDGEIDAGGCPMDKQVCPFDKCIMGGIVNRVSNEMKEHFKNQTLADLL